MTRSDLMTIAIKLAETSGRPYVETSAEQNAVANRRMARFAQVTRCLYSDAVALTLTPGTAIYDLRGAALARNMAHVDVVTVNGSPLYDFDGQVGLVSLEALRQRIPGYLGSSNGAPTYAVEIPPKSLRIWPPPDAAYAHSYVAGAYLPEEIDTSPTGDAVELEFADEDSEVVAAYVGTGLIEWTAATESDYERLAFFDRRSAERFAELTSRTQRTVSGPMVRGGSGSDLRTVSLG